MEFYPPFGEDPVYRHATDYFVSATLDHPLDPSLTFDGEGAKVVFEARAPGDVNLVAVFEDGRALVEGTEDPERARAIYDRTVGA